MDCDVMHCLFRGDEVLDEGVFLLDEFHGMIEIEEGVAEHRLSEVVDAFSFEGVGDPFCHEDGNHVWDDVFEFAG